MAEETGPRLYAPAAVFSPPTPLIGRQTEVALLEERLLADDIRLLTLIGPGGIGKTRLAVEVARRLAPRFADGVSFLDLAPLADPSGVIAAVGQALRIKETRGRRLRESVERYLARAHLLLVLDNFEQVLAAGTDIAHVLASCPGVKALVTSRAPLRITWEHQFPVPPLALPDLGRLPDSAALAETPAVMLFVARARAADPSFVLDEHNARAVAETCVRLDGLPLAIELAAARVRLLSVPAMLARFPESLTLLGEGPRDRPARHHTLRDAIVWSYDLLAPSEHTAFRSLSVFVGGFTLDAAGAVLAAGARAAGQDESALRPVSALADASLLRREIQDDGDARFAMLETVRLFGLEMLTGAGEEREARRRHARHFLEMAEHAASRLHGGDQALWLQRLEMDHGNLRAALEWYRGDPEEGLSELTLAAALRQFWFVRGYWGEGRRALEGALARTAHVVSAARANALNGAGVLALHLGDLPAAVAHYEGALELFRRLDDRRGVALVLNNLGSAARLQDDFARAEALYQESLAMRRELGDRAGIADSLNALGELARGRGDYARAGIAYEESLALYRDLGHNEFIATALYNLGYVALHAGEDARAAALFQESLAVYQTLGDRRGVAECLAGLGGVLAKQGRAGQAARALSAADALIESIGARMDRADRDEVRRILDDVRRRLDDAAFRAAWAEGRAIPPEDAVHSALAALEAPAARAARPAGPLTEREREVAALIVRGLTNRDIARALVITERTAANHVQHILNKLGFDSRTQIAVWASEQGLGPT